MIDSKKKHLFYINNKFIYFYITFYVLFITRNSLVKVLEFFFLI